MSDLLLPMEITNEHGEALAVGQKVSVKHNSGLLTEETVTGIFGAENDWSIEYFWAALDTTWATIVYGRVRAIAS